MECASDAGKIPDLHLFSDIFPQLSLCVIFGF